jgi:phosphoribosylpyrophosphate synthetase
VTNTIPLSQEKLNHPKIEVISIAAHLADIIDLIHEGKSISHKLVLA